MIAADLLITGAILLLLLVSAFFSGSETALTAVSRARMHAAAESGDRRSARARSVLKLVENRERLIGAVLLGNNLVNILASALATSLFLSIFGDAGVVYATLAMTALVLIFAEVMPKTAAIARTDAVALMVAPAISLAVRAFGPVVSAVQVIVRGVLRTFGLDVAEGGEVLSAHEELRGAIDLHHREGGVVKAHRNMLGGILDLSDYTVDEAMVHRKNMELIDADNPAEEIIAQVLASSYTRLPLWRDDPENIIGVLHAKDVLRALQQTGGDAAKLDFAALAQAPWFVPDATTLEEQLRAFLSRRSHFALVVDEYGALMGLITLEDILEEIVGDITDEHDDAVSGVRQQPDGSWLVRGDAPVRDLNRAYDWRLPDDEATTLAGLVIHEARAIPEPGQVFTFHGFRFQILERRRNQITQLRVRPLARRPARTENKSVN